MLPIQEIADEIEDSSVAGLVRGISKEGLLKLKWKRCDNPPTADQLGDWSHRLYNLEGAVAAKLGFGFGTGSLTGQQRVLVSEFTRSSNCQAPDGTELTYGVAVRLAVCVTSFDARVNLTFPMVAVETELNHAKTESTLLVRGYTGPDLAKLLPQVESFTAAKYVDLLSRVSKIQELISSNTSYIRPALLTLPDEVVSSDINADRAIGLVWGFSQAADGKLAQEAKAQFARQDSIAALDAIDEAYSLASRQPGVSPRD